jgi:hypothetical protein
MFTQLIMRRGAMCLVIGLTFGATVAQDSEKAKQAASSLIEEMRQMRRLMDQMLFLESVFTFRPPFSIH